MAVQGLLDFIGGIEAPGGYRTAYGGSQMPEGLTLEQTIDWARKHGQRTGSSAVGRYQFLAPTLSGLVKDTGIDPREPFSPENQDYLATELMRRRGLDAYQQGDMPREEFARNLAKEWAAIPSGPEGKSYYAGDKMGNKALTSWDETLAALPPIGGVNTGVDVRMAGGTPSQMVPGDPRTGRMTPQNPQLPPFPQIAQQPQAGPAQSLMNPLIALVAGLASGGGNFRANLGNAGAASTALQSAENDLYELRTKREDATRKRNQTDSLSKWFSQMAETPGLEDVGAMGMADPGAGMQLYAAKQKAQQEAAQREQAARTLEQQGRAQDAALVRSGAALGSISNQIAKETEYFQPQQYVVPETDKDGNPIMNTDGTQKMKYMERTSDKAGGYVDRPALGVPYRVDPNVVGSAAAATAAGTQGGKTRVEKERNANLFASVAPRIEALIDKLPNGLVSDLAGRAGSTVGYDTESATALKAMIPLVGALVNTVEKQPGPASDLDVALYRETVGNLTDPKLTREQRRAAWEEVKIQSENMKAMGHPAFANWDSGPASAPTSPTQPKATGGADPLGWRK